jgi:hypothetical protein
MTITSYEPQLTETSGRKVFCVTFDVANARTSDAGSDEQRRGTDMASLKSAIEADVSPAHPSVRWIGPRDVSDVLAKGFDDFMEYVNQNLYLRLA